MDYLGFHEWNFFTDQVKNSEYINQALHKIAKNVIEIKIKKKTHLPFFRLSSNPSKFE